MAISIYDPRTMGKLVERMPKVHTFIRDTFFRNVETFDTQKIDVDFNRLLWGVLHVPFCPGSVAGTAGKRRKHE